MGQRRHGSFRCRLPGFGDHPDPNPESQSDPITDADCDAQTNADRVANSGANPKAYGDPDADSGPDPLTDSGSHSDACPDTNFNAAGADPYSDPDPSADSQNDTDTSTDANPDSGRRSGDLYAQEDDLREAQGRHRQRAQIRHNCETGAQQIADCYRRRRTSRTDRERLPCRFAEYHLHRGRQSGPREALPHRNPVCPERNPRGVRYADGHR